MAKIDGKEVFRGNMLLTKADEICCYSCKNYIGMYKCKIHKDIKSLISIKCDEYIEED